MSGRRCSGGRAGSDEPRARRYGRRALVGILAAIVAYEILAAIALAYAVTHAAREDVPSPELGATTEDVTLTTGDGLELSAWYVPSRNGAAVIAFPGRTAPQPHARMLIRHGYGVCCSSTGEGRARARATPTPSAGAAPATSGPPSPPSRAPPTSSRAGSTAWACRSAGSCCWRWRPRAAACEPWCRRAPACGRCAARDGRGGEELNPDYFAAAGEPKRIWEVADGGHTGGLPARPAEYERRVTAFLGAYLL